MVKDHFDIQHQNYGMNFQIQYDIVNQYLFLKQNLRHINLKTFISN
jgi:hypothetical protein